jgi:predicted SAM-dependent methyltransferase
VARIIRPASSNWLSVDTVPGSEVVILDIFCLPWPLETGSFYCVLAKRILEHVPHNVPGQRPGVNFLQLLAEEIWRILKPGGILDVEVPQGLTTLTEGMDHKRIISTNTFHIFFPNDHWNYYTDCRFEVVYQHRQQRLRFRVLQYLLRKLFDIDITLLLRHRLRFCLQKK